MSPRLPGLAALALGLPPLAAGGAGLELELLRPVPQGGGQGNSQDIRSALPFAVATDSPDPTESVADGVLLRVHLPEDVVQGASSIFLQLFTASYCSPATAVEQTWFTEFNVPPADNPLRLTSFFDGFFGETGGLVRGVHGDCCVQYFLHAELCLQAFSCARLGELPPGRNHLDVWLPTPAAASYRLEAFTTSEECPDELAILPAGDALGQAAGPQRRLRRLSDFRRQTPDLFLARDRAPRAAAHIEFRLLFADEPSAWWASSPLALEPLVPTDCWMDMMATAVDMAAPLAQLDALWLEFGVASGRSLIFIARHLRSVSPGAILHGFDSFRGIPQGWHKYDVETFSSEGQPPDFLLGLENVSLHVGLFGDTLPKFLEEMPARRPVALLHADMDLFASAREVFEHLRCQLVPGTIIVFDELFNYKGWQVDGEYRAWTALAAAHDIRWRPLGIFFEMAVPIVVESAPQAC